MDYADLIEFAITERQIEVLNTLVAQGSTRKAAVALGVCKNSVDSVLKACKTRATQAGVGAHFQSGSPAHPIPLGLRLKGTSTLRKLEDGTIQWVKTREDFEALEAERAAAAKAFFAEYPPVSAPACQPSDETDIIPWFQIGDAHLGMVAWAREVGHSFDLDIGAREVLQAFKMLVDRAPAAQRCVINDLGDFTHYENFRAETEASGHRLDADGRFPKMVEIVASVLRQMIDYALTKYQYVDVIINQGNHSRTNDIHFRVAINWAYSASGRVTALDNSGVFIPYRMGNTLVITHHSDKATGAKLADAVLTGYRDLLRECEYVYVDTGHTHHRHVAKEYGLIQIETWNNLSPNDAHHHNAGWRSKQCMSCVVRSRKHGEVERYRVPIEMVWERLRAAFGGQVSTSEPRPYVYSV